MAIDPIAVTGGAATKMPTNTDVSAESNAATYDGPQSSPSSSPVGSSNSVDIFSYTNQQNQRTLPMEALSAEGKAQHFANPTTLGEQVLNYMEGFHQRVVDVEPLSERLQASNSEQSGDPTSTGPASVMPSASPSSTEGSTETDLASSSVDRFEFLLSTMQEAGFRQTETTLVSGVGQQFSRSMGTLMRGQ